MIRWFLGLGPMRWEEEADYVRVPQHRLAVHEARTQADNSSGIVPLSWVVRHAEPVKMVER